MPPVSGAWHQWTPFQSLMWVEVQGRGGGAMGYTPWTIMFCWWCLFLITFLIAYPNIELARYCLQPVIEVTSALVYSTRSLEHYLGKWQDTDLIKTYCFILHLIWFLWECWASSVSDRGLFSNLQAYQRLQIQQQMLQAQRNVSGPIRQQEQQVGLTCLFDSKCIATKTF